MRCVYFTSPNSQILHYPRFVRYQQRFHPTPSLTASKKLPLSPCLRKFPKSTGNLQYGDGARQAMFNGMQMYLSF